MKALRTARQAEFAKVAEYIDRSKFLQQVQECKISDEDIRNQQILFSDCKQSLDHIKLALNGGLLTYLLHCEARLASFVGEGFYTIGPCGEELLGMIGLNLQEKDTSALHYRHLATSIVRQLQKGKGLEEIALDRARGYTCSSLDPLTGGKHCCIGGGSNEFIVTSTLASQALPAVGRALSFALSNRLIGHQSNFKSDAVSYVSIGDGSINNAHFLSALNLAKYSQHSGIKCPVVFVVSNNNKCISLKGNGWVQRFIKEVGSIKYDIADGSSMFDVLAKSKQTIDFSRKLKRPSILLVDNLPRRFGHAATDRQSAYMSTSEIENEINRNPLATAMSTAIRLGIYSECELVEQFHSMKSMVEDAFDKASCEPKISSRSDLVLSNSQPISFISAGVFPTIAAGKKEVMRKHMTSVIDESLSQRKDLVYIGEDVEHGGYYLVTDGLAIKHPIRVRDYPPDEGSLVGVAMGFSQSGLLPILELPYAKYLDCAADMFQEAIITNWLTNNKQPNGMLVRLQGFDKGVFGGNFHTHNMLSIPPGLDVVCFSNGDDYVRGFRFCLQQAKAGRLVMSVDSTDLLNRRHLEESKKDEKLLYDYPSSTESLSFDDVNIYNSDTKYRKRTIYFNDRISQKRDVNISKNILVVSYGNGVPMSLIAQKLLESKYNKDSATLKITVADCHYLSKPPIALENLLKSALYDFVLFADVCKQGSGMPLSGIAVNMQNSGALKCQWSAIGASPTYNPLGRTLTFLSIDDIVAAIESQVASPRKS